MAIVLRNVSKIYRAGHREVSALRGVSLEAGTGELIAIVGPSTSGKSTLLHIIGCLDFPTAGSYEIDGVEVSRLRERALTSFRSHHIGLAFRSYHLLQQMTLLDEVQLPLLYGDVKNPRARGVEALRTVGLEAFAKCRLAELSPEQAPKVAMARALITRPSVLIFPDEPDFELDEQMLQTVWPDILALQRQRTTTVFITPHTLHEAEDCDRIAILVAGRLAAFDTPAGLTSGVGNDCVDLRTSAPAAAAAALRQRFGITARVLDGLVRCYVDDAPPFLQRLCDAVAFDNEQVSVRRTTLEDVCHIYAEREQPAPALEAARV